VKTPGRNQRVGRWGEQVAAQYLQQKGFTILERNHRTAYGELDLIVEKQSVICFVEVKARTGTHFGMPEEAITPAKRAHLLAAIQAYWLENGRVEGTWQVDVIAILGRPSDPHFQIEHFENALH